VDKYIKIDIDLIKVNETTDFNIYLYFPLNRKYIHFIQRNDVVDGKRIERCRALNVKKMYIPLSEYYDFKKFLEKKNENGLKELEIVSASGNDSTEGVEFAGIDDATSSVLEEVSLLPMEERRGIAEVLNALEERGEDLKDFYKKEAAEIEALLGEEIPDSAEKTKIIKKRAKELVEEIFSKSGSVLDKHPDKGSLIRHCSEIVGSLVRGGRGKDDLYEVIMRMKSDESNLYDHSVCVSVFSVIFAMGTGICDRKLIGEVSLGALMHDLGLIEGDASLMQREDDLSPGDIKHYARHCKNGVDILTDFGCYPGKVVESIILSHHENFDGSGFPEGIKGRNIQKYVTVVAIADRFDMLISRGMHPLLALLKIRDENNNFTEKSIVRFDPEVLSDVIGFLNVEERIDEIENK